VHLGEQTSVHVIRVLRLRLGDPITVFDGSGNDYAGEIVGTARRGVEVRVGAGRPVDMESPLRLVLLQGLCRGPRMDIVVQKATELGVSEIRPVLGERAVVRLAEERTAGRTEHWQRVAVSACEQCGRSRIPPVHAPAPLVEALAALEPGTHGLMLDPRAESGLPTAPLAPGLALLIGPEGGLTEAERELALSHSFAPVRLGPRILRTETAPLSALSILQFVSGDMGR